jgi:signal transduction histidine kinase
MSQSPITSPTPLTSMGASRGEVQLRGLRLRLLQALWLVLVLSDLAILIVSLPAYYHALFTVCSGPVTSCLITDQLNMHTLSTLQRAGFSLKTYAFYVIFWDLLATLSFLLIGAVIVWRRGNTWMGLFVSFLLINFGCLGLSFAHIGVLQNTSSTPEIAFLNLVSTPPSILYYPCLAFFFFTFPDGRLVPRWSWALLSLWIVNTFFWLASASPGSPFGIGNWPPLLEAGWLFVVFGGSACTQLYRYLRVASPIQRQQIKWLFYGFMPVLLWPLCLTLYMTFVPSLNQPGAYLINTPNSFLLIVVLPLYRFWYLPVPFCIGIALLRYRLWDIDRLINRTLVYGLLTASVIGLYVLIVGYFGTLFRIPNNPAFSLIATALVAIAFQPLRGLLQRAANRLMYGERDAPYQILARLDQQLARALPPEEILPALVKTIATTLKLPYVAVTLIQSDASPVSEERLVAIYGNPTPHAQMSRLPLVYQGETVGQFVLAPRPGEAQLTRSDRQLLEDLARHAGVIVHAVRLTSDLRRSRERLVVAREEERRRLRRDLHDGLGPMLASLTLTLAAARQYLPHDPTTTDTLLQELATHVQGAVADIRRLVYELRPPALDDLGLVGALRNQAARSTQGGLQVDVEAQQTVDPLPAAVEVAAYRIGVEALTNVVRHAQANNCTIQVRREADLVIEISDDGRGLPRDPPRGIGLRSMQERAEELGGNCVIATRPEGGTQVVVHLPLAEEGERSNGASG